MIKSEQFIPGEIQRRRGRPAGKNRIPLTLEERRARNAQYERERRTETAEAMHDLAEAAGCDPRISNVELLASVIAQLQMTSQRKSADDLNELRRINNNLMLQITTLEERLQDEYPCNEIKTEEQDDLEHELIAANLAPNIRENIEEQRDVEKTIYKVKHERLPGKRCLPESSDSDSQPEKIPKFTRIKTYNRHSTEFKSQLTSEVKKEIIVNECEDSSKWGYNSRSTLIEPVTSVISNHIDESKAEFKAVQTEFNTAEQSTQQHGCQSFVSETCLPHIEQSDPQNQCQLQSQSSLDLFTDVENGILSTWLECDDIFEAGNQTENVYEMKWLNDDLLQKFTS